jgi:glycerol-3-phosphate acyltransferase PlsX
VTDGFTGNIALKTGEGTAKLAFDLLKQNLMSSLISKLGALLARGALKSLAARIDPRRVNGGVFLGLNGTVVKSHGGSDSTGVSAAISLAAALARSGFQDRLAARVATSGVSGQDDVFDEADALTIGSEPEIGAAGDQT